MTAPAVQEPRCPTCQGEMWNERAGKYWGTGLTAAGKKKPTYKCKNKACGGALWIDAPIASIAPVPPPTASTQGGTGPVVEAKPSLAQMYITCTDFVLTTIVPKYLAKEIGPTPEAIAAMVHTLFIARRKEE